MNLKQLANEKRRGKGTSEAATRRRAERNRGTVLTGKPGSVSVDSRGQKYETGKDGSVRRIA